MFKSSLLNKFYEFKEDKVPTRRTTITEMNKFTDATIKGKVRMNGKSISILHYLCDSGYKVSDSVFDLFDYLVVNGIDVNAKDSNDVSVLEYAEKNGDNNLIHYILNCPQFSNDPAVLSKILNATTEIDNDTLELHKMLFAKGAVPDFDVILSNCKKSTLHKAYLDFATNTLGMNVNHVDTRGDCLLLLLLYKNRKSYRKQDEYLSDLNYVLTKYPTININARDAEGNNALWYVIGCEIRDQTLNKQLIDLLVKHGINVNNRNIEEISVISHENVIENDYIYNYLISKGCRPDYKFSNEDFAIFIKFLNFILPTFPALNLNATDANGKNIIWYIANIRLHHSQFSALIQTLVKHGLNLKNTALDDKIKEQEELYNYLVANGCT